VWHLKQLAYTKLLGLYLFAYGILALLMTCIWAIFNASSVHIHHAFVGILVIPITRFPRKLSAIVQAVAFGIFVQGYARWGLEPFLESPRKFENTF